MKTALSTLLFLITPQLYGQWTEECATGNGFVVNFETFGNELYATGFFTTVCGIPCNHLAKLGTNGWEAVGNGFSQPGHQLKTIGSELYGVRYESAIDSNWLYRFDGTNFNKLGAGVYLTTAVTGFSQTANLYGICAYNGQVVVSGEFDRIGSEPVSGIASWNGTSWNALGSGLSGHINGTAAVMYPHDLCTFGTDLIVAGNFKLAGGQTVNGIARWDGTQWHPLGQGFNHTVYGIAVYNGELYAGGDFTQSGSQVLGNIAKWNGNEWVSPGFSLFYDDSNYYSYVHSLKVLNDQLVISGGFDRVATDTQNLQCSAVISYNGTAIDTLNGGLTGKEAEALAIYQNRLYAGGGLNGSSYIARYEPILSVEEKMPETISIHPNPTNGILHLEVATENYTVLVYDATGRKILQLPAVELIDLSGRKAGLYTIEVQSESRPERVRILLY